MKCCGCFRPLSYGREDEFFHLCSEEERDGNRLFHAPVSAGEEKKKKKSIEEEKIMKVLDLVQERGNNVAFCLLTPLPCPAITNCATFSPAGREAHKA